MKYRIPLLYFLLTLLLTACSANASTQEAQTAASTGVATQATTAGIEPTATDEPLQMPEGRLLVLANLGDDGGEYSVINFLNLSVETYEPLNTEDWFFDWNWGLSPDARYLAYSRSINRDYGFHTLHVFEFSTGISTEILSGYDSNGQPSWTADGNLLAYDDYNQGLYIYDVGSGSTRHIAVSSQFSDQAAISPSGDRIAYKGGCPGNGIACPVDLYLINSDGSGERVLVEGSALDWIFWSKDGHRIYFSMFGDPGSYGNVGSGYKLYAIDVETGANNPMAEPQFHTFASSASFLSPNGEYLAYNFGDAGLQVIKTADNSQVAFLPSGYMAWSLDSRYIVTSSWEGEWNLFDIETGQSILIEPDVPVGSQIVGWLP